MSMRSGVVFIVALLLATAVHAQSLSDSVFVLPDTARPFTLGNFYELILKNHPVAKQAALLSEVGRQEIRLARGNFDPKLETQFLLKHYNETEYYRLFDGSVKLPTRSPVTPTVGVERNKGQNLNPENYISAEYDYRQLYAGLSIPLGRGLITDERRTALRQSELFRDMMEAEQIKTINKLLLDAAKEYWQWYYSYYNYRLASNTVTVAQEIFRRTKLSFEGGEVAAVDTVQSKITFLERQVARQEAYVDWRNTTQRLSVYLWDSLMNPLDLSPEFAPVADQDVVLLEGSTLEELVNQAKANHPELRKVNLKIQQLELDRRLASEFLKPKLDVSYYMLNQPIYPEGFNNNFVWNDNYKLGVDFSFPLFLRKERAKVAQARLKLSTTRFDRDLAARQIVNDINVAYTQLANYGIVLQQQRDMVDHYYRLMNAELLNLENGESDLFKINVQQEKLFNAQSKYIKVLADYQKQKAILYWSAGVRPLSL
ncbi:MAG TPA: TolC family protein [Chryseosolibacter sp.]